MSVRRKTVLKWAIGVPAALIGLVVVLVALLYVPGVLNFVASKVLPKVEQSSGMKIETGDVRLRFPLRLTVKDAVVITPEDTMLTAAEASVHVAVLPLLTGRIDVESAEVRTAFFQMGGVDSLYVGANADTIMASGAMLKLSDGDISVKRADLRGARIRLVMGDSITKQKEDTTQSAPMHIRIDRVDLSRVQFGMLTTTDTIGADIRSATLTAGVIDLPEPDITVESLVAKIPQALYAKPGVEPLPGLDVNYLQLSEGELRVDTFAMHGTALRVPISTLHLKERCGLTLDADGQFSMDSTAINVDDFRLLTTYSSILLSASMGMDTVPALAPLALSARAEIGPQDVAMAMPSLSPAMALLPELVPLRVRADMSGTMQQLTVDTLTASMQRVFSVSLSGEAENFTDIEQMKAFMALDGHLIDSRPVNAVVKGVRVPPLTLSGTAEADCGAYAADLRATTASGRLALKGTYAGTAPDYSADLRLDSFPVRAFMPDLGIGAVSLTLDAKGRGFDPYSQATVADVKLHADRVVTDRLPITDVTLNASLRRGQLNAVLLSGTPQALLDMDVQAGLSRRLYSWDVNTDIHHLDLRALGVTDSVMDGTLSLDTRGYYAPVADSIQAFAAIRDLDFEINSVTLRADSIRAQIYGTPDTLTAAVDNRQLHLALTSSASLMNFVKGITTGAAEAQRQIADFELHADTLHRALPPFRLTVQAGADNLINDYLRPDGISFRNLNLSASNDSLLRLSTTLLRLQAGENTRIDTITASVRQYKDLLVMKADMGNRPGTFDAFARVRLRAAVSADTLMAYVQQKNIKGDVGFSIGFESQLSDSLVTVHLRPYTPVIAYKNWTINEDNYIAFNPKNYRLDADLRAYGDASRLELYTQHQPDTIVGGRGLDNVVLRVSDIKLQDWLSINPFAPPIAGSVSADMTISYDTNKLNGDGTVRLQNLTYGKERVGDFDLAVDVNTTRSGVINADVALMVDSIKTITATGALNDSTKSSPFLLDFNMIHMPLKVANPFLPKDVAQLSGTLNGVMEITGSLAEPVFNGYIDFDEATVDVQMIGSSFRFSEEKVPVDSNVVRFSDYTITGSNANPLSISGTVDMHHISDPQIDLSARARNMQVINSKKRKNVDIFGKAYIDLDATVQGNLNFMNVNADLDLLPLTDVTYVVSSANPNQIGLQNTSEMVHFVNFTDSLAVLQADSLHQSGMLMMITAGLNVHQGSTLNVYLSPDGKNRAQIQGDGILNYTQTPMDTQGRLTGRFTINQGFVRYSMAVISEKLFNFVPGSYVAFNGAMLNPILSVKAVDQIKANVTRSGENSRLVDFDVSVSATGTLETMNLAFDLNTNDDITVQNELQSMSAEQRANQAMNLLLYNTYTGPGTTGNANLSGNPLYSFLASQLNTWAANTIKGVDVTFGMDQYDRTRDGSTSTATSYSYKVSKSLFNNRFKIVVGGNYSTDADADENFSQNLISDVSFEYMLNDAGSMYVRLFRHTGFESILEGEVTQTGVGFVVKRKLHRLGDIFRFINRRNDENE